MSNIKYLIRQRNFFYNDEVADRSLADWEGDWQSVYPYLVSGDLDEVFAQASLAVQVRVKV